MKNTFFIRFIPLLLSLVVSSCEMDRKPFSEPVGETKQGDERVSTDQKKDMILLTERPANLETPLTYFKEDFTPNEVFFVRWHLANMPQQINPDTFRLRIGGAVKKALALSLNDLKTRFPQYSLPALAVCAGNARSTFDPRVPGAQWKNGAMGNARWTGVRLRDILAAAQPSAASKEVAFNGMDSPPLPEVPDFVKSLTIPHCMDGEVMVAYAMNGKDLPMLNGYPLKLVVPGWYASYWVGMLDEIKVYEDSFKGYWMDKAYRIPKNSVNGNEKPDSIPTETVPLSTIAIRSIFVWPLPEAVIPKQKATEVQGLAFDQGSGISKVELSTDGGKNWVLAKLDPELGKYAWRRWRFMLSPNAEGTVKLLVRATNRKGETQPEKHWNHSGYLKNEIEEITYQVK